HRRPMTEKLFASGESTEMKGTSKPTTTNSGLLTICGVSMWTSAVSVVVSTRFHIAHEQSLVPRHGERQPIRRHRESVHAADVKVESRPSDRGRAAQVEHLDPAGLATDHETPTVGRRGQGGHRPRLAFHLERLAVPGRV